MYEENVAIVFFLRKGGIQSKPEQQKELYSYEGI